MLHFILNRDEIKTPAPAATTLLDFIRYQQRLTGTKIGCREGDCGACSILCGEMKDGRLVYSSATSCLMPLANAHHKHIVSIEGLNLEKLNKVQEAFAKEGATQCGFCTPGFIVSLSGFCMSDEVPVYQKAIDAMNGNICRCTGYKSIERAAARVCEQLGDRQKQDSLEFAVDHEFIPSYFLGIKERLLQMEDSEVTAVNSGGQKFMGGGTDLYVQQHDTVVHEDIHFLYDQPGLKGITKNERDCEMGASVTVSDMAQSPVMNKYFPNLPSYIRLLSSTPIRNMATIAGNFINASPIGDLTVFFLALDTRLRFREGGNSREIKLRELYKGYKLLDKSPAEYLEKIYFELPGEKDRFNFEKVSKRTCLDIASVNSAIFLRMNEYEILEGAISAGGVSPVPLYLAGSSRFLAGKKISVSMIQELVEIVQTEISPISDARGSDEYKRLLLAQLIKAHFIKLFPELPLVRLLTPVTGESGNGIS